MTIGQGPGVDDLRSAPLAPCPCGRGDVAAETERQRPLLERALAGDGGALAELYDGHVDDVYRYLLAWTGDERSAKELTGQVFHGALNWLPVIAEGEGDLAAWLMTMARDAVAEHKGTGWAPGLEPVETQSPDVLLAAARLDDAHREVVVLRLLLGHSLAHTAHLAGYSPGVVSDLQLAACSAIWQMLSGTTVDPAPPGSQELRPRWFESCLEGAYLDPSSDPGLSDVLAVADALRQAAPRQVPLPDDAFLRRLREQLLGSLGAVPERPASTSRIGRAFALARLRVGRHPWVATVVAASAVGLVFGLQAGGSGGARSACGDRPCLATTTEASAAPEAGAGFPTIPTLGATTILSTTSAPPTTLPPTTRAPAVAPSTVPPTTAARTTQTTRRATTTTTTRRTGKPTTTTTAPPPTTPPPSTS